MYDVPSHWHMSIEELSDEAFMVNFTQNIIDTAQTIKVEDVDTETVQFVLSKLKLDHRNIDSIEEATLSEFNTTVVPEESETSETTVSELTIVEHPIFSMDPIKAGQTYFKGRISSNANYKMELVGVGELEGVANSDGIFEFEITQPELIMTGLQIIVSEQQGENWIEVLSATVDGEVSLSTLAPIVDNGTVAPVEVTEASIEETAAPSETIEASVEETVVSTEATLSETVQETETLTEAPVNNLSKFQQIITENKNKSWKELLTAMDVLLTLEELKQLPDENVANMNPVIGALLDKLLQEKVSPVDVYSQSFVIEYMLSSLNPDEHATLNVIRAIAYQYHALKDAERLQWLKDNQIESHFKDAKTDFLQRLEISKINRDHPTSWNNILRIAIATGYKPEFYFYDGSNNFFTIRSLPVASMDSGAV